MTNVDELLIRHLKSCRLKAVVKAYEHGIRDEEFWLKLDSILMSAKIPQKINGKMKLITFTGIGFSRS